MKNYELTIERRQPTCGGQSPFKCEIRSVSTDDPVAYVRTLEPNGELNVSTDANGDLCVEHTDPRGFNVKYIFTEE
ncbi:MAG: hypothetical protein IJM61_01645 [Firmicutes bacterium]|nr:hypothetical protein [Bacillota bacterium]